MSESSVSRGSSSEDTSEDDSGSSPDERDSEQSSLSGSSGHSSGRSSSRSGSGSGTASSGDDGSDESDESTDSGEQESVEDEEKKLLEKREDFERMKQLSAHMDNVVQRLAHYFPFDDLNSKNSSSDRTTAAQLPELPVLPQPDPIRETSDQSVSARTMTMDRAVLAKRLTTDRAVSAASSLLSREDVNSVSSNSPTGASRAQEKKRERLRLVRSKEPEGGRAEKRVGNRKRSTKDEVTRESVATQASLLEDKLDGDATRTPETLMGMDDVQRRSRERSIPSTHDVGNSYERLIWDDLRESLAVNDSSADIVARKGVGDAKFHQSSKERAAEQERRRRLIDDAISVLLEDSDNSDEEGPTRRNP